MPWKEREKWKEKAKTALAAVKKTRQVNFPLRKSDTKAQPPPLRHSFHLKPVLSVYRLLSIIDSWINLPMKSNASWKYCLIFWWGVSLAGICIYFRPCRWLSLGLWQVTFNTQLAPTLLGSSASRPLPSSRCGNTGEAGCVSISAKEIDKLPIKYMDISDINR